MQMLVTRKKKKKNVLYYSWPVNLVTDVIVFPSPYHTHTHLSLEKGGWIKSTIQFIGSSLLGPSDSLAYFVINAWRTSSHGEMLTPPPYVYQALGPCSFKYTSGPAKVNQYSKQMKPKLHN